MPGTRKLGRPTAHRMSMLRGMVTFLLENGRIETTATRAAEVSALADKMIELLSDDERRMEVGRKMKARAEAFTVDKIGKKWIEYIALVCGKN